MQHTCQHVESLNFFHTARETSTIVNCHLSRLHWKHLVILFLMVRPVYLAMQRLNFNKLLLFFFFLFEFHAGHSIKVLMLFNFFLFNLVLIFFIDIFELIITIFLLVFFIIYVMELITQFSVFLFSETLTSSK